MSSATKYQGWIASAIYNGLQKLSLPIFGVISTMILAHKALLKEEMGVWSLFLIITTYVDLIRQGLVRTSVIKFLNHSTDEEHKFVLTAALFWNVLITVIIGAVLFLFAPWFAHILKSPHLEPMLKIFSFGLLLLIPFSHFEWIMYGKLLFKGLFWTYFVRQGLSLLLMVTCFLFVGKITLNQLVIFYCIGIFAGCIVCYFYVKQYFIKSFQLSKEWLVKFWHYGKYVFGTGLSNLVFRTADQMMLSPLLGSTVFTASQSVSLRVINLAEIPSQVLGDILFPKSATKEASSNPEMIKYYYEKTVGATLCFVLPVVAFILIFPKLIILILAGKMYYDAIPYLQLISLSALFLAFLKQFGVITDSTGKPNVNFITITILALFQVGFCYFFIKNFGLIGAAYAVLATHIVGFFISQALLKKYYKVNFLNCFKYAFKFYPELFRIFAERMKLKWKTN